MAFGNFTVERAAEHKARLDHNEALLGAYLRRILDIGPTPAALMDRAAKIEADLHELVEDKRKLIDDHTEGES
jgi:hypothetical protein